VRVSCVHACFSSLLRRGLHPIYDAAIKNSPLRQIYEWERPNPAHSLRLNLFSFPDSRRLSSPPKKPLKGALFINVHVEEEEEEEEAYFLSWICLESPSDMTA